MMDKKEIRSMAEFERRYFPGKAEEREHVKKTTQPLKMAQVTGQVSCQMYETLIRLLIQLNDPSLDDTRIIRWGAPVPFFGDLARSKVATLGINPSNLEFINGSGAELQGEERRFHTLASLGIDEWSHINFRHLRQILRSCRDYFLCNPYDRWFKKLDRVISGSGSSYYNYFFPACHLDLIPYATEVKWNDLGSEQKRVLFQACEDELTELLRDSIISMLVLNGRSVIARFQEYANIELHEEEMDGWGLPRRNGERVKGFAYSGVLRYMNGNDIGRDILILGFNHNLQSSFGVTNEVMQNIHDWIKASSKSILA